MHRQHPLLSGQLSLTLLPNNLSPPPSPPLHTVTSTYTYMYSVFVPILLNLSKIIMATPSGGSLRQQYCVYEWTLASCQGHYHLFAIQTQQLACLSVTPQDRSLYTARYLGITRSNLLGTYNGAVEFICPSAHIVTYCSMYYSTCWPSLWEERSNY